MIDSKRLQRYKERGYKKIVELEEKHNVSCDLPNFIEIDGEKFFKNELHHFSVRKNEEGKIKIEENDLLELIFWARRYCDGRSTYAPHNFNKIYKKIRSEYPDLLRAKDQFDKTLKDEGIYWPYAQDGNYNKENGQFDARI